ncbi:MAG: tetratricopeptide repeat protein [Pirellulales bacterium]|nr:tetratricopeptide repeat protein [Pirellulales bacterium]
MQSRMCCDRMVCWLLTAVCASGCALGKQEIVPDSIARCREMSRDGVAAMERAEWGRARTLLEKAVDTSPSDIDARRHLAEALWETGARREATVQLEAAVKLDPRHATTVVRAGEMLLSIGATDRALRRAEEAIALDPTKAAAWALRGRVFRHQGNEQRALADMQQALRYAPHMTDALQEVAELQYALERPHRTLTTLHHLLDIYPPGEEPQRALWLEGLTYGALGRHADAVNSLAAATQQGTPPPDLLYQLALAEKASGQPEAAANTLRQALALDASHRSSQLMLAQLQGPGAPIASGLIRR